MIQALENIIIEPIHEKHAWRICDFCTINNERLKRYFPQTLAQNLTPDLSKYFVEQKVKAFKNKEEFLFVLKEKENHTIIGVVYVKELDWNKKQAELAYAIGYQEEGKGRMTKVIDVITDWAFNTMLLQTLQIIVHKTNIGSIRVAEKCGFTWQKLLIAEHTPPGEKALDMELYERYNTPT